jgi:hypothetical protein
MADPKFREVVDDFSSRLKDEALVKLEAVGRARNGSGVHLSGTKMLSAGESQLLTWLLVVSAFCRYQGA